MTGILHRTIGGNLPLSASGKFPSVARWTTRALDG